MKFGIAPLLAALATSIASAGGAGVSAFGFQGSLADSGGAASGLYDFQVCLFDDPTTPIPLDCTAEFIEHPVEDGLFSLVLDFGPGAFVGDPRFLELRVRRSSEPVGYTILAPRQPVRPAPEAINAQHAGSVPWAGITGLPPGFADGEDADSGGTVRSVAAGAGLSGGTITETGTLAIAEGGVTQAMLAPDAVDSARVVDGSLVAADLASGAVTAAKIAPGAVTSSGIADGTVASADLADGAVTGAKIAAGSIGAAHVDGTQIQRRVQGGCGAHEVLAGIGVDGVPTCLLLPIQRTAEPTINTRHASVALLPDGRPVVSHTQDDGDDLLLSVCADQSCSSHVVRTLDSTGIVGAHNDVTTYSDGRPLVSYYDASNGNLKLYRCADIECTSGTALTLDSVGDVGKYTAVSVRSDGRPVVAYSGDGGLKLFVCAFSTCTTGSIRTLHSGIFAIDIDLALRDDDRPVVSYGANSTGTSPDAHVYVCADAACASGVAHVFATTPWDGYETSVVIRDNGRPHIAHTDGSGLNFAYCSNSECTSRSQSRVTGCPNCRATSLVKGDDGGLVLAYTDENGLWVHDCEDDVCSATAISNRKRLEATDLLNGLLQTQLRDDGRLVVLRWMRFGTAPARLYSCASRACN